MSTLKGLLHILPAIILMVLIEIAICCTVGATVMMQLLANLGRQHPYIVLAVTILAAVGTHVWIVWNHKVREYINARSQE